MPIKSIKVETKELKKAFKQIERKLPSVTAATINKMANNAKKNAFKNTAGAVDVPVKFLNNRYTLRGEKKEPRSRLVRANPRNQKALMIVYMRGIPISLIAGKAPKKRQASIKARGGRQYKGAFYADRMVFKRRKSGGLMVPKIGIRAKLMKQFDYYLSGTGGKRFFSREWNRAARVKLAKISR